MKGLNAIPSVNTSITNIKNFFSNHKSEQSKPTILEKTNQIHLAYSDSRPHEKPFTTNPLNSSTQRMSSQPLLKLLVTNDTSISQSFNSQNVSSFQNNTL